MIADVQWALDDIQCAVNHVRFMVGVCDMRYTAGDLRWSFGRRTFVFTTFCVWAMCGVDLKLIREKLPDNKGDFFNYRRISYTLGGFPSFLV